MATAAEALSAFEYYTGSGGYYEKASADFCDTRAVEAFAKNKGSANYTWMGRVCGLNPAQWCAMMVSTAVYEACGNDGAAARKTLWGRWPHYNCGTLFDDANAAGLAHYSRYQRLSKGRGGAAYTPAPGDVAVYSDDGRTRTHTGMVYSCDGATVYVYEGNAGNMVKRRSYPLSSAYLYGFCTPAYEGTAAGPVARFQARLGVAADGVYGPVTKKAAVKAHQTYLNQAFGAGLTADGVWGPLTYYATRTVRRGDENDDVTLWQGLLYCTGFDPAGMDGDFGANTEAATEKFQQSAGLTPTGGADRYTWAKLLGAGRPAHTTLRQGSAGPEVAYLQELLTIKGFSVAADGQYGPLTAAAVKQYQSGNGLEADGVCGPDTWKSIE